MRHTIAQQKGFTFAPIPFAAISFLSSSYVIHYLLFKERQKLQRLYHRLILAMNFALLPLSFTYVWSNFAVPEGTPNYIGASGTINTCTAQGFISVMLNMTVPTYYVSLSLQAFMGMKHKFQEENYQWIEKFIHLIAWCVPAALASILLFTDNLNPNGSGCHNAKAPQGCESDPDVPCERGGDVDMVEYIVGLGLAFLYFVFPPSIIISMYCWIKKLRNKMDMKRSTGMQQLREYAQKEMVQQIAIQICLYLFSFWFTFVPTIIVFAYTILNDGKILYDLLVFANCVFALQGFVMAMVYFTLQRLGTPKVEVLPTRTSGLRGNHPTVQSIRTSAMNIAMTDFEVTEDLKESLNFNIFDGVPDEDSPWAQFFDEDDE
mmetsp:Transcript_9995/g.21642  ORF Transcript_9995/g.21642 Transcript_9995/m.21642 type:complete len:376 (+) Transcript_9995:82-1209(+)